MSEEDYFYSQLNTKTIADNDATSLQGLSDPVHLEKDNQQLLRSIKLVNEATLRSDGGPIPDTQQVFETVSVTDGTRTVGFSPNSGEIWSVMNIVAKFTNITGTSGVYLYIEDTKNSVLQQFFYGSTSSTSFMLDDDGTWDDFRIGYPCRLQFMIGDAANWDSCLLQINMLRIR